MATLVMLAFGSAIGMTLKNALQILSLNDAMWWLLLFNNGQKRIGSDGAKIMPEHIRGKEMYFLSHSEIFKTFFPVASCCCCCPSFHSMTRKNCRHCRTDADGGGGGEKIGIGPQQRSRSIKMDGWVFLSSKPLCF